MKKNYHHKNQRIDLLERGFTLVEIMVAMAIGLFLIAGVYNMFISNNQSYRIQDNLSRLQDNGRFATNHLGSIIRMAGFKADPADTTTFTSGFTPPAVQGSDSTGAGGSDMVSVSFQAAADGTTVDCLGKKFPVSTPPTMITDQFYLAVDANNVSNLYCKRTSVPVEAQPLVENVTDMQITYGVDANNDGAASFYVAANKVIDWSKVVSIHLSLLLDTQEDNITTTAQVYRYNGATVTASDKRLYQVFNITIALRNRLA